MDGRDDVKKRIYRVVDYIEDNLGAELSIDELAGIACYSRFHFHRVFASVMGTTPSAYILDRRLERAAHLLITSGSLQIDDISCLLGFSSPSNFSRAFRARYRTVPSGMKKSPQRLLGYESKLIAQQLVHLRREPGFWILYERRKGFPSRQEDVVAIMDRLARRAYTLDAAVEGGRTLDIVRDIPTRDMNRDEILCDFGVEVDRRRVEQKEELMEIPAGTYAFYRYTGAADPERIIEYWMDFYLSWLRYSGLRADNWYGYTVLKSQDPFVCELYLPVRP